MLRTPLCDLLGIEAPVLCAPFGPWDQLDLAVAVCEAGGLGAHEYIPLAGQAAALVHDVKPAAEIVRELVERAEAALASAARAAS